MTKTFQITQLITHPHILSFLCCKMGIAIVTLMVTTYWLTVTLLLYQAACTAQSPHSYFF